MLKIITKSALLSKETIHAYNIADYRLRHNARYFGWSEEKRTAYRLGKAFDAALIILNKKEPDKSNAT